eukprot:scaffold20461_cov117-Cylindrotheca_fusiformis.AAC.19
MEELSQPEKATNLKMFWQMVLNLVTTPVSKDAHKLEGEVFSAQGFTSKGAVYLGAMYGWQGELLVFFDLESAANRAIKDGDKFATLSPGVFHNMRGTFLQATALFAIARRTRKRKYRTHTNKLAYRIKGWTTKGNPNVRHYHMALMAEQAALRKKYDLAEEYYKDSISLAARTGHMHDAALINERYAEFLREELLDERESRYRLGEAIRFYEAWGAFGKAELQIVCQSLVAIVSVGRSIATGVEGKVDSNDNVEQHSGICVCIELDVQESIGKEESRKLGYPCDD